MPPNDRLRITGLHRCALADLFDAVLVATLSRINVCSTRARAMKLATVDALTDLEHRLTDALSDALSKAECARLEFEARLATALMAEERIVPPNQPSAESPPRRSWWPFRRAG